MSEFQEDIEYRYRESKRRAEQRHEEGPEKTSLGVKALYLVLILSTVALFVGVGLAIVEITSQGH